MAKSKKPRSEPGDGGSHKPFAALAGMRAKLPTKAKVESLPQAKRPAEAPASAGPPKAETPIVTSTPRGYSHEDRVALSQALTGVKPLPAKRGASKRAAPQPAPRAAAPATDEAAEAAARARLDALVGGGVHFELSREDGRVEALRQGAHASHLRALLDANVKPDLQLDLHGLGAQDAKMRLSRFVRDAHGRGARTLLVIHGKGRGSRGAPVLGDAALDTLMHGGAAPLVSAIATAPRHLGGEGALLVRLGSR